MLNILISVFLTAVVVSPQPKVEDDPALVITFPSQGVAQMDWDAFGGSSIYTVEVFELPGLNRVHYSTTTQLTETVSGLTSSVTYRYKVANGTNYIIMDTETP